MALERKPIKTREEFLAEYEWIYVPSDCGSHCFVKKDSREIIWSVNRSSDMQGVYESNVDNRKFLSFERAKEVVEDKLYNDAVELTRSYNDQVDMYEAIRGNRPPTTEQIRKGAQ